MSTIVGSKAALPAFKKGDGAGVKKLIVTSNETGKDVSLINGLKSFSYYESILQDVVRATVSFVDTGDSIDGKTVMEGLPVYGSEKASIKIQDNNENVIEVELFVNKPDDLLDDTRKKVCVLNFASKEFLFGFLSEEFPFLAVVFEASFLLLDSFISSIKLLKQSLGACSAESDSLLEAARFFLI